MTPPNLRAHTIPMLASYVGMVSLAAAVNISPTCVTALSASFGLDEVEMGRALGTTFSGLVIGILLSGPLSDHFGMRSFILIGAGLQAAGMMAVAAAPTHAWVLNGLFVTGVGSGAVDALLSPLVCALQPKEKARAMNLLHAFYCIGAVLTVGTTMVLLRVPCSWRTIFMVGTVPSLLTFVGIAVSKLPPSPKSEAGYVPVWRLLCGWRFLILVGAMLLCGGSELGPAQWFPAYLERAVGWQRENSGVGLLFFSVTMAAGRLTGARLARSVTPRRIIVCSGIACGVLILGMSQSASGILSACCGILVGFACAPLWPTTLAYTAGRFPGGGAAMFSVLAASGNSAGLIFPITVGFLSVRWGMHWALASLAILPLLLVVIFAFAGKSKGTGE